MRVAPPQSLAQPRHPLQTEINWTNLPVHVAGENVPAVHVTVLADGV